ncbi:uncharacterized protein IWZ02DRAFT_145399 [Phyllosticta citriasiana]|uniref:Uncharacterized protein n=1 Tax=Phyllosticta citriasiana TaxID=595635 RepID=A0ABR1K7H8_9PEZI
MAKADWLTSELLRLLRASSLRRECHWIKTRRSADLLLRCRFAKSKLCSSPAWISLTVRLQPLKAADGESIRSRREGGHRSYAQNDALPKKQKSKPVTTRAAELLAWIPIREPGVSFTVSGSPRDHSAHAPMSKKSKHGVATCCSLSGIHILQLRRPRRWTVGQGQVLPVYADDPHACKWLGEVSGICGGDAISQPNREQIKYHVVHQAIATGKSQNIYRFENHRCAFADMVVAKKA